MRKVIRKNQNNLIRKGIRKLTRMSKESDKETNNNLIGSLGWNTLFINNQPIQLSSGFTVNSLTGTITFVNYTLQLGDEITGLYFKTF